MPVTVAVLPVCVTVAAGDTVNTALPSPTGLVQLTFAATSVTPDTTSAVAGNALVACVTDAAADATPFEPVTTTLKV